MILKKYPTAIHMARARKTDLVEMARRIQGNNYSSELAQLPQLDGEIEVFLNSPTTETLYLSDFFFSFFEKRQNSD